MHNRNFVTYRMRGDTMKYISLPLSTKDSQTHCKLEFPLSLLADEVALNTCLSSNLKASSQQADISLHSRQQFVMK